MPSLPLTPVSPGSLGSTAVLDPSPAYFGAMGFGQTWFGWAGRVLPLMPINLAGSFYGESYYGESYYGEPGGAASSLVLTPKSPGVLP